jgi:hypothetical protein
VPSRRGPRAEGSLSPVCATLALVLVLAACGGGDTPPSELGTLAYVETECRTKEGFFERQALRIRQGEREPVTVFETPDVGPLPGIGLLCLLKTAGRFGDGSIAREAFQSVAVSPDGTSVVFEVTDEFSTNPPLPLNLPSEQKGFFWVRADGTGLRWLGPPSRERFFYINEGGGVDEFGFIAFNPSGRTIAFVDKGPDTDGHEADQVATIDVATGRRTQLTRLSPAVPPAGYPANTPTVFVSLFSDERTVAFSSCANPDGMNPEGNFVQMTIKTDGSGLDVPLPIPIALPGGVIEEQFVITGDKPQAFGVVVPGKPTNDPPLQGIPGIREIFVVDEGKNVLQLTNFRRQDTLTALVDVDRDTVFFEASADPFGENPSRNCQLFSIDRLGANLRQLTDFHETEHSVLGCLSGGLGLGCALYIGAPFGRQDPWSRTLIFYSNCDPLRTNPNGAQVFAIQPDGSGLRQLTDSRGLVREADGTYSGELPGPWAYGPYAP